MNTIASQPKDRMDSPHSTIAAEVAFLLNHPESGLSVQKRNLLTYLLQRSMDGKNTTTQQDISLNILSRSRSFNQDTDANARVAVQRLRKALDQFYANAAHRNRQRVFIPKGRYCLEQAQPISEVPTGAHGEMPPAFAWVVRTDGAPQSAETGFALEGALATDLVKAPLIYDGAMDSIRLQAADRNAALDLALHRGATLLAEVHITWRDTGITASLTLLDVQSRAPLTGPPIFWAVGTEIQEISQNITVSLSDPIQSLLPEYLSRKWPESRLAAAMYFFRFMAKQDRRLLPQSLAALENVYGTPVASPLTDALRLDAIRASYCFRTTGLSALSASLVEEAHHIRERAPFQPYAALAQGYMQLAVEKSVSLQECFSEHESGRALGSLQGDIALLDVLSRTGPRTVSLENSDREDTSFFHHAAGFVAAMTVEDHVAAEAHAFAGGENDNIWMSAFQASISHDRNQTERARSLFGKLCQKNPGAEDYLDRAISTMIPNEAVHERILHGILRIS